MSMIPPPGSSIARTGIAPAPPTSAPTPAGSAGSTTPAGGSTVETRGDDKPLPTAEAFMASPASYQDGDGTTTATGVKAVAALLGQGSRV
jgi:hypothetical protein